MCSVSSTSGNKRVCLTCRPIGVDDLSECER